MSHDPGGAFYVNGEFYVLPANIQRNAEQLILLTSCMWSSPSDEEVTNIVSINLAGKP